MMLSADVRYEVVAARISLGMPREALMQVVM